jgi:hypothetical protein
VSVPESLPAGLRYAVLNIVGHTADQATYDTLRTLGMNATSAENKGLYFNAMANASEPALIRQNVEFSASGEMKRRLILPFLLSASSGSGKPDLVYSLVAKMAAPSSRTSESTRVQATRFAAEVDANVELRGRTTHELKAWMASRNHHAASL